MALGDRIKKHRLQRGWTYRDLGKAAAVDAGWIYRLETGERSNISLEAAKRLALALGVTLDYLAGITTRSRPLDSEAEGQDSHAAP